VSSRAQRNPGGVSLGRVTGDSWHRRRSLTSTALAEIREAVGNMRNAQRTRALPGQRPRAWKAMADVGQRYRA
jgi:hypothetical protein